MTADIAPFSDALYAEMLARIKQTDLGVPARRELSLLPPPSRGRSTRSGAASLPVRTGPCA
jgi:hypothetical protein